MSTITKEQVMAFLANPENAKDVGLKYPIRQRVNISANQDGSAKNLLFSDKGKSGALGRDTDGNIYYMANIRGRGRFPSFPLSAKNVSVTKDGKLTVTIEYSTQNDAELSLIKAWLGKTAQPTLAPAKPRSGYTSRQSQNDGGSETPTSVTTETESEPEPAPTPVKTSGFDESQLSLVQKAVRSKAIELGLYTDIADANSKFDQWKNTTMKQLA